MGIVIDKWDIDDKKAEAWIVKGKMQIRYHGSIHNIELSTVGLIPKADYENRLKADLKAILVELQLEIEKIKPLEPTDDEDWQYGCFHGLELMQDKCLKLIQQKINSLKREE